MSDKGPKMHDPVVPANPGMPLWIPIAFFNCLYAVMALGMETIGLNELAGGTALAGRDGIAVAMAAAFFGNYIPWLHAMGWVGAARWKHNVGHPITHIEKADVNDPTARHEYLAWTRGFYNLIEWQFLYIGTQAFLLFTNRPGIAMITSVGWAVGRMLYTSGYARQGAPARQVGLILSVLGGFGPGIGFMWIDIFRFMSK